MTDVVLWDYPKSSASYRVRIALGLAGVKYRVETVNLLKKDHKSPAHMERNPQGLVPVLEIDGHRLTQSLAIIEYLDATRSLGLLPDEPLQRAKVRALAYGLAVDVHPVCNLSVVQEATGGQDPARRQWMQRFIRPGLLAFEALSKGFGQGLFCTGARPSLADICLIPQLYNANRWGVLYGDCPRICAAERAAQRVPAFVAAHPE